MAYLKLTAAYGVDVTLQELAEILYDVADILEKDPSIRNSLPETDYVEPIEEVCHPSYGMVCIGRKVLKHFIEYIGEHGTDQKLIIEDVKLQSILERMSRNLRFSSAGMFPPYELIRWKYQAYMKDPEGSKTHGYVGVLGVKVISMKKKIYDNYEMTKVLDLSTVTEVYKSRYPSSAILGKENTIHYFRDIFYDNAE